MITNRKSYFSSYSFSPIVNPKIHQNHIALNLHAVSMQSIQTSTLLEGMFFRVTRNLCTPFNNQHEHLLKKNLQNQVPCITWMYFTTTIVGVPVVCPVQLLCSVSYAINFIFIITNNFSIIAKWKHILALNEYIRILVSIKHYTFAYSLLVFASFIIAWIKHLTEPSMYCRLGAFHTSLLAHVF